MTKTLDDRIADAFESTMTSAELKALLDETNAADEAAKAESAAASKIALDPAIRPAKVAEARKRMEDANFRSARMTAAAEKLADLLDDAKSRERAAARKEQQDIALAERALVVIALQEYEELAQKISRLMERLAASNASLEAAFGLSGQNETAEIEARGPAAKHIVIRPSSDFPTLVQGVRLPRFREGGYHWPPPPRY